MAGIPGSYAPLPLEEPQENEGDDMNALTEELGPEDGQPLNKSGFWCLLVQHASNTGGDRTSEYLFYLLLVMLFQDTLLPSAIYGFGTTLAGIVFSRWTGTLVDKYPKLVLVRTCILIQKLSAAIAYGAFTILFSFQQQPPSLLDHTALLYFFLIILSGSALRVSTICIQIAVEKDWVIAIADRHERHLSRLNVSLRRVDLLCNLLSPLIVSVFTTVLSYRTTAIFMIAASSTTMLFELYWIQVVYNAFPELERDDLRKEEWRRELQLTAGAESQSGWQASITRQLQDWSEFVRLPVFLSSLAVSLLYITVLSFDGNMLGYLKTKRYDDGFIALMRGIGVLTGLLGTVVAPTLEQRLGSVRAGSWSIWSEVACLIPVVLAFAYQLHSDALRMPVASSILVFGGMAASRVGLWSFDLIQVKQLQETLADHPRRNTLSVDRKSSTKVSVNMILRTALQYSMANVADLFKYILAMALSQPRQFPWAAIASFTSVFCGAATYTIYLRQKRGHVFHVPCTRID